MLEEIKEDLADNFQVGDDEVLQQYIDETTLDALSISNRENNPRNIMILTSDIKKCVKSKYLQRGSEGSKSLNTGGVNSGFENPDEIMRIEIVKSGKRVPFL